MIACIKQLSRRVFTAPHFHLQWQFTDISTLCLNGRNVTDCVCPYIVDLLEESNIYTVLEMLASSSGSLQSTVQNASREQSSAYQVHFKVQYRMLQGSNQVLILPIKILNHHCMWSTSCITVTTTLCITNKLK